MHLPASILSWLKSVTAPLLGWDPRPIGLRDTLPDQPRPTVPTLPRAAPLPGGAGARIHAVQIRPAPVGTSAK
jgi:hypothetical protein